MKNLVKYSAGIVSLKRSQEGDGDNYFADGRTREDNILNLQVSIEKSGDNCLFCVFDDIKEIRRDGETGVTLAGEISKLYKRIGSVDRNIDSKINMMSECIRDTDNLIYSATLGMPADRKGPTAFAGLIFSEGQAAALNIGGNRVCLYRNGILKPMAGDRKKMERLLKMGIITLEQAKDISPHFGTAGEGTKEASPDFEIIDLRAGDVFVLMSGWLANALEDDRLAEILDESGDVDKAAAALAKEALDSNFDGDITAMVIYIEDVDGDEEMKPQKKTKKATSGKRQAYSFLPDDSEARENFRTYVAAVATSILIIALLFCAYIFWIKGDNSGNTSGRGDETQYTDDTDFTTTTENDAGENGPGTGSETEQSSEGEIAEEPSQTPNESGSSGQTVYTVQSGDTLSSISQKFYGNSYSYDKIMEANDLKDPNSIYAGQQLIIP